jgi:hypothetical protein
MDHPSSNGTGRAQGTALGPEVESYLYQDAWGRALRKVVRHDPKDFRQYHPLVEHPATGNPAHWEAGVQNVPHVPYRLPELQAADPDLPIVVVEGEKAALRVWADLGLPATCCDGGAGHFQAELGPHFINRDVIIVRDNDEPGQDHAQDVAAKLRPFARSTKVVVLPDLPPKGDIVDWLDAGGTIEDFTELVDGTALWTPSGQEQKVRPIIECVADIEPEEIEWLEHPYLPRGVLVMQDGDPGVGKSYLTLAFAAALSRGRRLTRPDQESGNDSGTTLLVLAEDDYPTVVRPRLDRMGADVGRIFRLKSILREAGEDLLMLDPDGLTAIRAAIAEKRPRLVVIDPVLAYVGAGLDTNKQTVIRSITRPLGDLARDTGVTILATRHLTKADGGKAIYRGQTSIDWNAAARSCLLVAFHPEDKGRRVLAHAKSNEVYGESLGFRIDGEHGLMWEAEAVDLSADDLVASALGGRAPTALETATTFLERYLRTGAKGQQEVELAATAAGISKTTLTRAKGDVGVLSERRGEKGKQGGGEWVWALPVKGLEPPETVKDANAVFDTLNISDPSEDDDIPRLQAKNEANVKDAKQVQEEGLGILNLDAQPEYSREGGGGQEPGLPLTAPDHPPQHGGFPPCPDCGGKWRVTHLRGGHYWCPDCKKHYRSAPKEEGSHDHD